MTTATATATNGRARRSLNDSIAKLDEMVDGLSAAIPETIGDTLRETVGEAVAEGVKAALVEIFSRGDLLELLRGLAPAAAPRPAPMTLRQRLSAALSRVRTWTASALRGLASATANAARQVCGAVSHTGVRCQLLWGLRKPLLVAAGVGCVAAVLALVTPSWFAALLSGVGAACASLAAHAGLWLRRARFALVGGGT